MRRRDFISIIGVAAALPVAAMAQKKPKVIGVINGGNRPQNISSSSYGAIPQGLADLGYVEGRDFRIEWRFAEGKYDRFADFATEMVMMKVDVIVVPATIQVSAVQKATSTIPIVMCHAIDPIGNGFI